MDEIKAKMESIINDGIVKGHMGGPQGNVMICDTLKDFSVVGEELAHAGYKVASSGDYGGSDPESREAAHNKVWVQGALCAITFKKREAAFGIFSFEEEYLDIVDHC